MPEDNIVQPTVITPGQTAPPPGPAAKKIAITDGDAPAPAVRPVVPMPETPPAAPVPNPMPSPPAGPLLANRPPAPKPPAPGPVQMTGAITSPPRPGDVPKFGELQPKIDAHPLFSGAKEPAPKRPRRGLKKLAWLVGFLLAVVIVLYLLVDAGVIKGASHLPFHIFKQPVATTTPVITPATTNPYAGWKSDCDSQAKTCFYYPSTWTAKPSLGNEGIDISNASTVVDEIPAPTVCSTQTTPPAGATGQVYVTSIDRLTSSLNLKVVGGYWLDHLNNAPLYMYNPKYQLVRSDLVSSYKLQTGSTATFPEAWACSGYGVNNLGNAFAAPGGSTAYNDSTQSALSWFNTTDAKTSLKILESAYSQL